MIISENNIFKFSSISEFTFRNLLLSEMWFAPPSSMNDQLEGYIKVSNPEFVPSNTILNKYLANDGWARELIEREGFINYFMKTYWFNEIRNNYGISCFTKDPSEPLMWAHYADKHSGLCLIYDQNKILHGLKDIDDLFDYCLIDYLNKPVVTFYEKNNQIEFNSNIPIISSKSVHWKYEKEIRLFTEVGLYYKKQGTSFSVLPSSLKGIIYGAKMSEDNLNAISYILRNDPLYKHVIEYQAYIDYMNGSLYFEKE